MSTDYTDLAHSLNSRLPLAYVLSDESRGQAEPWLSAHVPDAEVWGMASHLGFWDRSAEFNERLSAFLSESSAS